MDELLEHQRREEDEEFWERKRREESRPKGLRSPDHRPTQDTPIFTKSTTMDDNHRSENQGRQPHAPEYVNTARTLPKKKTGRLFFLYVLALLVLCALGYQGYSFWQMSMGSDTQPSNDAATTENTIPLPPVTAEVAPLTPVEPAGPTPEQIELNNRLDRLEARLGDVIEGLRAQGYIIGNAGSAGEPLPPTAFAPRQVAAPAATPLQRRTPVRRVQVQSVEVKPPPVIRQQLLSVDMWDGRPSVVVGNGDPSNPQVRVLQPGDSFNGITLTGVDVAQQRATFSDGTRSISLDKSN